MLYYCIIMDERGCENALYRLEDITITRNKEIIG